MEPIYLDTIAFTFPELKIIGAHLGIGYYDVAAHVARWRRNVFFDISGGEMVRRHIIERKLIPSEISHFKLLYGSDNNDRFEDEIRDWQTMFDMLRLNEERARADHVRQRRATVRDDPNTGVFRADAVLTRLRAMSNAVFGRCV